MRSHGDGEEGRGRDGEGEGVVGSVSSHWGGCQFDLKRNDTRAETVVEGKNE